MQGNTNMNMPYPTPHPQSHINDGYMRMDRVDLRQREEMMKQIPIGISMMGQNPEDVSLAAMRGAPPPPQPPAQDPIMILYVHRNCSNSAPVMDFMKGHPHLEGLVHIEDLSQYKRSIIHSERMSFLQAVPTLAHAETGAKVTGTRACIETLRSLGQDPSKVHVPSPPPLHVH
jgi:hypothetical protein